MHAPPDPEKRTRRPCKAAPFAKPILNKQNEPSETISEFQVRSLRRRFALGYYFAATVAQLAWGALPR